jgi:hypothetical protein
LALEWNPMSLYGPRLAVELDSMCPKGFFTRFKS